MTSSASTSLLASWFNNQERELGTLDSSDFSSGSESGYDTESNLQDEPSVDLTLQENTSGTALCFYCGIEKPIDSFKLQSRYSHTQRRGTRSSRCEECRRKKLGSLSAKRRRKRKEKGDNLLIQEISWGEMMQYFERDVRHDVEYIHLISFHY